jgi:hypothetical protein
VESQKIERNGRVLGEALINPTAIVEVLSDSTEDYDRGEKFAHYIRVPSLKEYVLVAPSIARIEVFRKPERGHWVREEAGAGATVQILGLAQSGAAIGHGSHYVSRLRRRFGHGLGATSRPQRIAPSTRSGRRSSQSWARSNSVRRRLRTGRGPHTKENAEKDCDPAWLSPLGEAQGRKALALTWLFHRGASSFHHSLKGETVSGSEKP